MRIGAPLVLLALLAAGCGGKTAGPETPEALVQAFDAAMKAGDTGAVAALWDYEGEAKRQNPDWDDIPAGQRDLIIGKLREEKADQLKIRQQVYAAGDYSPQPPQVQGNRASVLLKSPAQDMVLNLVQRDGGWRIESLN